MTFANKIWIFLQIRCQCEVAVLWLKVKLCLLYILCYVHFVFCTFCVIL